METGTACDCGCLDDGDGDVEDDATSCDITQDCDTSFRGYSRRPRSLASSSPLVVNAYGWIPIWGQSMPFKAPLVGSLTS